VSPILYPVIVLGSLLFLLALLALLGRFRGGRYLRPLVTWMTKVPLLRKGIKKASMAQLERENPELARAVKKMEAFGTPKTPEQAQRALALLSPGERKAYLAAVSEQSDSMPEPTNRAQRRLIEKGVQPGVTPTPRPVARKKRR
jgi:cell division protein FtsB